MEAIGKRPDVLIFRGGSVDVDDVSGMNALELTDIVKEALLGIEIRSSSFLAKKYRQKNKDDPTKYLSFTPKLEDIQVVLKWVETYDVPHYYAQVFFDEIHMISFKRILETVRDHAGDKTVYKIANNPKNQAKTTIHINIAQGQKVGDVKTPPIPKGEKVELDSGRLLHYVSFNNGAVTIDGKSVLSLIES